jgi:hypothetical protein
LDLGVGFEFGEFDPGLAVFGGELEPCRVELAAPKGR